MKISDGAKKAIMIGSMCSMSYLAVYIARGILGAVTPYMVADGIDKTYIGTISSAYFIVYAIGQLINGAIGDKIKAKWMISFGLVLASVFNFALVLSINVEYLAPIIYGCMGFCLAMIYGPMTKVVAENTEMPYTTRCSLGYTFASFIASPLVGVLAIIMPWEWVFYTGSIILVVMGITSFAVFTGFERKGMIKYNQYKVNTKNKVVGGIGVLIKRGIILFSVISIITGVVRTSVVFWLPTFIAEYHRLGEDIALTIYTVITFVTAFTTFIAIFVYERLRYNMNMTMILMFGLSTVFFILTYFIKQPVFGIIFIVLAIMSSNASATMLFSKYCPSLKDTGMVSTATGFIDFVSYVGAAVANVVFPQAVGVIGWENLILIWAAIVFVGFTVVLLYDRISNANARKASSTVSEGAVEDKDENEKIA